MKKIFLILILLVLTVIESNANQCNLIKTSLAKSFCYERAEDYNLALKNLIQAKSKSSKFGDFYDFYEIKLRILSKKNSEESKIKIEKFKKNYPDSIFNKDIDLFLANILFKNSNISELKNQLKIINKKYKLSYRNKKYLLLFEAKVLEKDDETKKAFFKYLKLWSQYPNFKKEFINKKLKSLNRTNKYKIKISEKITRYKRLLSSGKHKQLLKEANEFESDEIKLLVGKSYIKSGNHKKGLKIFSDLEKKSLKESTLKELNISADAKFQIILFNLKKYDDNNATAKELTKLYKKYPNFPKNEKVAYLAARLYILNKDYKDAYKVYDWLIKTKSKSYLDDSYWGLGWSEYMMGNYKDALNIFAYLEQSKKPYYKTKGMYWKARCLEKMGERKESVKIFNDLYSNYNYGYYGYLASNKLGLNNKNSQLTKRKVIEFSDQLAETTLFVSTLYKNRPLYNRSIKNLLNQLSKENRGILLDNLIVNKEFNLAINLSYKFNTEEYHRYPLGFIETVEKYSEIYNVEQSLILALSREESLFDVNAISVVGAKGLMQLMDKTKADLAMELNKSSNISSYNYEHNIELGTYYLSKLLRKFDGNYFMAISAYNAGPHNVEKWLKRFEGLDNDEFVENIPFKETHGYVKRVIRSITKYRNF